MDVLDDLAAGKYDFAPPGAGVTAARLLWLADLARVGDVSTARLAEAHLDAVAILREAGREPAPGSLYGVWASASDDPPRVVGQRLTGTKRFCSGVGIVDRALVTMIADDGERLVEIDATMFDDPPNRWASSALRDTATADADLDGVTDFSVVADATWYLTRPGFWHGACAPAACWAGAAFGIVDAAVACCDDDPHRLAQTGALVSAQWSLTALLHRAGDEIDSDPTDRDAAELRGRALRHITERASTDIADRFSRVFGPRPFVTDVALARRFADLHLYLRQHHGERELGAVAALARRARR